MNKSYRHGQILKLVRSRSLRTQEELARALASIDVLAWGNEEAVRWWGAHSSAPV